MYTLPFSDALTSQRYSFSVVRSAYVERVGNILSNNLLRPCNCVYLENNGFVVGLQTIGANQDAAWIGFFWRLGATLNCGGMSDIAMTNPYGIFDASSARVVI
jgi:hypothetical protein